MTIRPSSDGITLKEAKAEAERTLGYSVKSLGFEERRLDTFIVNVYFFSALDPDGSPNFRMAVYVNGKARLGFIL